MIPYPSELMQKFTRAKKGTRCMDSSRTAKRI